MRYAVYRPRTRVLERTVVYALLGVSDADLDELPIPWTAGYRRAATVSASTPGQAAVLGEALLGDILVPATGSGLLCTRNAEFVAMPRPSRARA